MDKDNSLNQGGGFPLLPGGFSMFASSGSGFPDKAENSGSRSLPPFGLVASGGMDSTQFSHDVSQMSDNAPRNLGHRRARSEFFLPGDIPFAFDLGIVGGLDGPSLSDEIEEEFFSSCLDMDKFDSSSATSGYELGEPSSSMHGASGLSPGQEVSPNMNTRVRHQHSRSLDGSTLFKSEVLTSTGEEPSAAESRKSISAAKLAELAVIDPKRAKRIWANRQSAARSKERKMKYMTELEKKLQTLQTEESMLSAQLTVLEGDTTGLNTENNELKVRLQSMEQQVNLQDALNESLNDEIQHLKLVTNHIANGGPFFNYPPSFSGNPQFYSNNHSNAMHTMSAAQQFQLNSHRPQHPLQQFQQMVQPMMQQREHLQQSGNTNLRGNVPPSYAQYGNASYMNLRGNVPPSYAQYENAPGMGSRDWN